MSNLNLSLTLLDVKLLDFVTLLNLITILTPAPGMNGPRLCSAHFSPNDIIVTEATTRLRKNALPKREKSQSSNISNDVLLVSRDGVLFPSNSSNLARRSPMIRNLLGDCPSEETTIIMDIEATILNTVLELLNESSPTFPLRLYESVIEALKIFQIEQFVRVDEVRSLPKELSKQRKRRVPAREKVKGREDGTSNFDKIQVEVEYEDSSKAKDSVDFKNHIIDCPYTGCQKKIKGKRSFLRHLCVIHHKNDLESRIIQLEDGKFKCPQCNLDSMIKDFVVSHFGIREALKIN